MRFKIEVSIGILILLAPAIAAAETPYGNPGYWRELRREEYRERRHYHRAPRVYSWRQQHIPRPAPVPHGHHAHCLPEVRAHGTPHVTEDAARAAAQRHWQAIVRYDHGEKYMSIDTAQHVKWRCARAETNETTAGRVAEALTSDAWRMRCEIVARPCRTELRGQ